MMGASVSTIRAYGGSWGLRFVPTYDIMEQVQACLELSEREFLLGCLDEIHRRCDSLFDGKKQAAAFYDRGVVEALLEMLQIFKLDAVFLLQAVTTAVLLCAQDDVVLDHFLDLGGREAIDETLKMHKHDQMIVKDGTKMASIIRRYAKGAARRDAARVSKACRYCITCRRLEDRPELLGSVGNCLYADRKIGRPGAEKRSVYPVGGVDSGEEKGEEDGDEVDPAAGDLARIERLLDHMEKFPKILDVVEPCVDALIAVGKSGVTEALLESKCVFELVKAMKAFLKSRSLQWKGLLALIHLGKRDAICSDLGKAGAVQLLVDMWRRWEDDEMRQLILWAMNELARLETNQLRMSAERVRTLLRDTIEPALARHAATDAVVTGEQEDTNCIPIRLMRLYRNQKLGNLLAKKAGTGDNQRCFSSCRDVIG